MENQKLQLRQLLLAFGLILLIAELSIWLISDFLGFFMSLLLILLAVSVLLISQIAEWLERSRLPQWFFPSLYLTIIISLITLLFFGIITGFQFDWQRAS